MNEQQKIVEGEFHEVPSGSPYVSRGDSFDIGQSEAKRPNQTALAEFIANPSGLAGALGLTSKQAENIASIVAGAGAGAGYKYLSKFIGGELAAALGGFLGAYVSGKLIKK
jgi:hypothetical protein